MRALLQRVTQASVTVEGKLISEIGPGLLILLGVTHTDSAAEADKLAAKIARLRIFPDDGGPMNAPLGDREILVISQFTLYGDTRRGNRPSWTEAAPGARAEPLYDHFCATLEAHKGIFGADMAVALVNDGPVTLLLEA